MANVLQSPEDVINLALGRIGYKLRIGSIWDGSEASVAALDIYGQTRDLLLREGEFGFAKQTLVMTLQKTAPPGGYNPITPWSSQYPILPWIFQYAYPTNCLRILALKPAPYIIPVMSPRAVTWTDDYDPSFTPPQRVVLTNLANAVIVYNAQVTTPQDWDVSFVELMADALAVRLSPMLSSLDVEKVQDAATARQDMMSKHLQG